jgi:lipoate-protein ligase A
MVKININEMLIIESQSLDVYRNLAIEEYLMEPDAAHGPVLFLWRSDCAVVMGKNQNPWLECRLDRMRDDNIPLARRISGGGTVYHDEGNLNYCIIVDRTQYREGRAYDMVLQALSACGIQGERSGKSNLSVDGRKFSGNAFCFRKGRALHHGTLLLHADLARLARYLGPMFEHMDTRAIPSVPAEVANLGLGVEKLAPALADAFRALYGEGEPVRRSGNDLPGAELQPLLERQRSEEWKYGATPRFAVEYQGSRLEVERGIITAVDGPDEGRLGKPFNELVFSTS